MNETTSNVVETEIEDPIFSGLNEAQSKVILHQEGPLLVIAGAGTGKTSVLTRRIAYLIRSKKALPSEILALTFTDRAANEMEERVDRLVPYGFNDVWVSTFHSFGDRLLRDYAFDIGLSPNIRVFSLPEAIVFVTQHLFDFKLKLFRPLQDPTRFVEMLLSLFSRAKDEEISPEEFLKEAERIKSEAQTTDEKEEAEKYCEIALSYKTYEDLKLKKGFIDFGDQVILALKILRERPSILKKFQNQFKYILVDEFQDTNYAQFELVKLLAGSKSNLTVVGDDDQSIYKFRGACLSNILGFRRSYPNAKEIVLEENYRSTQSILDSAYQLIQHNNPHRLEYRDQINKSLQSQNGLGKKVEHLFFESLNQESDAVALEIHQRVSSGHRSAKDFAILVRTNLSAEPFLKSLNALGIPWRFSGNAGLYDQEEIKLALSFLRVLESSEDSNSLYFLAVSNLYKIDIETVIQCARLASKSNRSLFNVIKEILEKTSSSEIVLSNEEIKKISSLLLDIKKYRRLSASMATGRLLYDYFESVGLFRSLAEVGDWKSVQTAQNLYRFFELIKKFGEVCEYDRAHFFIQYIDALRSAGEDPASAQASLEENAVNVLTVHAAKGLEFPIVYMVGLEQGHFPLSDRKDPVCVPERLVKDILPTGDIHIQEERRLFYVGMTRAKEELILCSARDMGKKKSWKVSQFILETMDKPSVEIPLSRSNPLESLQAFSGIRNQESIKKRMSPLKFTLSVTSIEEYLNCPMKYKFSHLMKIPVGMHHTAIFGMAVHEALKGYHLARKEVRKMSLEEFQSLYKSSWKSEGFISREHEEKRFQEGLKILKSYYKNEEKSQQLPTWVEKDFRLTIEDIPIRGRWDRVDISKEDSVIIDFKTADVKNQKEADSKARLSHQLLLYSLAFKNQTGSLPKKTVLHFIKNNLIGLAVVELERVEKAWQITRDVIWKIKEERFSPNPGFQCRFCPYEKICPGVEKREV